MKRRKQLDLLRWQMSDYTFDVYVHSLEDMPFLRVMTPFVPNSWCVVFLHSGFHVFADPILCECWGTLESALACACEYAGVRFTSELNVHYGSYETPHVDVEIWHLVPFDPYEHV